MQSFRVKTRREVRGRSLISIGKSKTSFQLFRVRVRVRVRVRLRLG